MFSPDPGGSFPGDSSTNPSARSTTTAPAVAARLDVRRANSAPDGDRHADRPAAVRRPPVAGDVDAEVEALVASARAGDVEAFATLYERYARRVHAYCLSRVRQSADAEDLTQLTFLKVVEALPRYESRGLPFAAWLFTLARNVVIDFARARRDHATLDELRDGDEPSDARPASDAADSLAACLPFLTAEQRDVIAYRFFAGLSARETARLMGREETAVRALQHRALVALRRSMLRGRQSGPAGGRDPLGAHGRGLAPIRTGAAER